MAQQFSYSNQVKSSVNYMLRRLGRTITYKRLQALGTWTPLGLGSTILWEWPSFTAVIYDTTTQDIEKSGGRLELGDKAFLFLNSVFTDHSDYEYIQFVSGSTEFTAGETITGADSGATATIVNWYEDSGTWTGSAAGAVWVSPISGDFDNPEAVNGSVGGNGMAITASVNTSGGTDETIPKVGDKIIYGNYTYKIAIDEEGGGSIIREDSSKTTSTCWGRVVENE